MWFEVLLCQNRYKIKWNYTKKCHKEPVFFFQRGESTLIKRWSLRGASWHTAAAYTWVASLFLPSSCCFPPEVWHKFKADIMRKTSVDASHWEQPRNKHFLEPDLCRNWFKSWIWLLENHNSGFSCHLHL